MNALLIFAKLPEPGVVKTRLLDAISPQQAAQVHRASLEDTVRHAAGVPGCRKALAVAAPLDRAVHLARALGLSSAWRVSAQQGRGLGERLHAAFASAFRAGCRKVVVMGTDTPWMSASRILQALRLLDHADVVLGPTTDGGYYLVGARRLVPQMFRGIPWSTPRVFDRTLAALAGAGASFRLLPRDFDLDRPEDLDRAAALLRERPEAAPALAQVLAKQNRGEVSRSSRRRAPARRSRKRRPGRG